nr:DUF4367 domain-containing protein [uncultured Blautia sp.]
MRREFEKNQRKQKNSLEENLRMQDETEGDIFEKVLDQDFIEREKQIDEALFADESVEDRVSTKEELHASYQDLLQRYKKLQNERKHAEFSEEFSRELVPDERLVREIARKKEKNPGSYENAKNVENRMNRVIPMEDARERRGKKYSHDRDTNYRLHRLGKVVGMSVVAVACVFAASMTSEANRNYLVNSVRIWSGDDSKIVVYNDESNEDANADEEKAIADIEEKLGVEVPIFYYRPYGMEFLNYDIKELTSLVRMEYEYKTNHIILLIDKQNDDTSSRTKSVCGDEQTPIILNNDGIDVEIKQVYDEDGMESYSADWNKDGVVYVLYGKIELQEIKKIIEYMKI